MIPKLTSGVIPEGVPGGIFERNSDVVSRETPNETPIGNLVENFGGIPDKISERILYQIPGGTAYVGPLRNSDTFS